MGRHERPQRFLVPCTDEVFDLLAVNEQEQRRHALDVVVAGKHLLAIDIDREDRCGRLRCDRFDDRFEHLARATPVRVEIDQYDARS